MAHATVAKAFGLPGGVVFALVSGASNTVTLTDAAGRTVYRATVVPLTHVPTTPCGEGGQSSMVSVSGGGPNTIP